MQKSPEAFRTISEVATWLKIPAHVLRFWESQFSQIKPTKRSGGRRYYRPSDMLIIGGIKKLLHEDGMTIKGAKKIIKKQGIKSVAKLSPPISEQTHVINDGPNLRKPETGIENQDWKKVDPKKISKIKIEKPETKKRHNSDKEQPILDLWSDDEFNLPAETIAEVEATFQGIFRRVESISAFSSTTSEQLQPLLNELKRQIEKRLTG